MPTDRWSSVRTTPGPLDLAASAAGRTQDADVGRTALRALADRSADSWDIRGPGLCHGTAGALQVALRMHGTTLADAAAGAT
ncbi:hypothetical protein ACFQ78_27205 [Streptomyces sp. NPDC056519]|uniref:hypothetical protein n=1 Tax=Streptomyces sp. NPDC056519 TaxID=3345849 RepID=UPI0036C4A11C